MAIAFDRKAPTFRHQKYAGYKANRKGMPEELAQQLPVLQQLLTDLGYQIVSCEGWEADDILGTFARVCREEGSECVIATGDRDSLQLVDASTTVLLATNKETIAMDEAAIQEKYGVTPPQLIEVKSLMGDASDNIPGVAGIGEKTALSLIQKFGSLENVYQNIDDKAIKPKQRENLINHREEAELSHMLGTIRRDAPIDTVPQSYLRAEGDPAAAAKLLADLEMHKLVERWGLNEASAAASPEVPLPALEAEPMPFLISGRCYLARTVQKDAPGRWYAVQVEPEPAVYSLDENRHGCASGRRQYRGLGLRCQTAVPSCPGKRRCWFRHPL